MSTPSQIAPSPTFHSWLVVVASSLLSFYIFIQMNLLSSISSELVQEFNFDAKQLSQLFAFHFYGNIIFLFPAGILLDRFSVRNSLIILFAISIIATYLFSTAHDFWIMNIARFAIGFVGAFSFLAAVKIASNWFKPQHMALAVGIVVTITMLGGVVAQAPLTLVVQKFGWRSAVQLIAALGILLAILQLIIVRDAPKKLTLDAPALTPPQQVNFLASLGMVMANKQNWFSGFYISLINLPLFILGGIWGVPYLTQVHHFSLIQATTVTGMIFIGMMLGSPIAGLISDYMGQRKLPMIIGAILSLLVVSIIVFAPTLSCMAECVLYLALGLAISSQVIGYPVITESNPLAITATATSLGSALVMSGGMLVPVFGWLLEQANSAQLIDNIKVYSPTSFLQANYLMLAGLVIALVISLAIRETYCKQLNLDKNN